MSPSLSLVLAFVLLCLSSISLTEAHRSAFGKRGFSVELIHRDSSKSPFYRSTETHFQRVRNAVRRSFTRANHFNCASTSLPMKTPQTDVTANPGEYLMSYSVGTPPSKFIGVLDTGSDMVWLQCMPCITCFHQDTPMFDPSKSRTYKTVPCNVDTCHVDRGFSCASTRCQYIIGYGDGSYSQGPLSMETLTIGSNDGSLVSFLNTVIGCGNNNTLSVTDGATGIVGLGRGPLSLITQMGNLIQGKFSYCLVPMFGHEVSSKLNFGANAIVSGVGAVSTPMVPSTGKSNVFYSVTLEGFSVGNNRVEFGSPSVGSTNQGINIILDSGTTLTLLPNDIYSKLETAVAEQVKLKRVQSPSVPTSLCYESTPQEIEVPVITAHFSGADVKLNALNTFIQASEGVMCFAFSPSNTISIFGNLAQQNFLVGYDVQNNVVNFKPTDCTKL